MCNRLAGGNTAKFWLGLQDDFDLEQELIANKQELLIIKKRKDNAA